MNRERRKEIAELITSVDGLAEELESVISTLQATRDDENSYYEEIPENLKESERAQASSEAIDCLEEAIDALEDALDGLQDASGDMGSAVEC